MKILNIETYKIKPYKNNPREITEEAIQKVAKSIEEYGFKVPIVITPDYTVVTGHTRLLASEHLGLKEIPCIIAEDLSAEQIQAFRIADNRTAEETNWDMDKLNKELEELEEMFTGFDFEEIDLIELSEANIEDLFIEDTTPEEEDKPEERKEIKCPHCQKYFEVT